MRCVSSSYLATSGRVTHLASNWTKIMKLCKDCEDHYIFNNLWRYASKFARNDLSINLTINHVTKSIPLALGLKRN
jgi:hypothetical protein